MSRDSFAVSQAKDDLDRFRLAFTKMGEEISKSVVGHEKLIEQVLIALLSGGHVLIEGVPGLGKTHLVNVLGEVLGLSRGRIQCTPDLMPSDILGTHILRDDPENGGRILAFEKGPVFKHLLLVDEINRATPKSQSALLEVMQESRVSAGNETYELPEPFFLLATQNPLEMEGTYPLPEAQLDRFFFKLLACAPKVDELMEIARRTTGEQQVEIKQVTTEAQLLSYRSLLAGILISDPVLEYAARLIEASHGSASEDHQRLIAYGSSPRGMQALVKAAKVYAVLDERTAVSSEDVKKAALPTLRHRMILNFEGQASAVSTDTMIAELLDKVAPPADQ